MATNLKPLNDKLIVRRDEAEETTASGIVLPDAAQEKPTKGTVLAVGPGKLADNGSRTAVGVKVDEVVYYGKYSGTEVEVDGEKLVILRESDVLGVLE
jgi:chaperonin GroES